MSYWHLFGGPVEVPVFVGDVDTGYSAHGIAEGLVGPVDRPPIEEDYIDQETGKRYEHLASWNQEPTKEMIREVLDRRFPQFAGVQPFAEFNTEGMP